ncbi:lipoprotein signal peptidase [Candidatus Parcubacteria bacterium]|nr:MAG: lipoprotein signal peptidase [Candidatus Parcubacteria bacterium]
MFSNIKKTAPLYILAVFFISIDRFLKLYFLNTGGEYTVIDKILKLRFVKNTYIAFSIPISPIFVKYLSLIITLFLIYLFIKFIHSSKKRGLVPLFLIILGSSSNILDRFSYGFVIDYIDLSKFAIFNIADSMIFLGVSALIYIQVCHKEDKIFS